MDWLNCPHSPSKLAHSTMLSILLTIMLLNPLLSSSGSPTFQEEYRSSSYVPEVIDTRASPEKARYIEEQIERATVPELDEYISIDKVAATVGVEECRD
ncbi:hypothetical protein GE09DRAFT_1125934 [Coniochaeta sp. 2T2.1]|nr:hypothetical protein GE09DRAFT_1125934 [Coniochaeta sp. 2T2.1]